MTRTETYRVFSGNVAYLDNDGVTRKTSFTVFRNVASTLTRVDLANLLKLESIDQVKKLIGFKLSIENVTFYV